MDENTITFEDCLKLFNSLENNMKDLESITISANNENISSFLKNDSGLKRHIIYLNGNLQENYDGINDSKVNYLKVHRELSFGIFGTKILEDFEIFLENGEYKSRINSGYKNTILNSLGINKY